MASADSLTLDGPVYFWGAQSHDYDFMSQWYLCAFVAPSPIAGRPPMTFHSAEQYMMYRKAVLFEDLETAEQIMWATTPRTQKALGRQVKNFDAKKWEGERDSVVEDGNWYKFASSKEDPLLVKKLLATGDRLLVEVRS